MINTRNLTKTYGSQKVVNNVSMQIDKGHIYGLLGRNGAGKTTLIRMILGLTAPSSGIVELFGKPLQGNEKTIYSRIGTLVDGPAFYPNLTASENLQVFSNLRGKIHYDAVKNVLDLVELPYNDRKQYRNFSLGMKQRLGLAGAIIHDPELLILDEPINGLDAIGISDIRDFLKRLSVEQGKTILLSSHILSEISLLADDVGILHNGILVEQCSYEDLQKKNRRYYILHVSSISKASCILEQELHFHDYKVEEDHICIYDQSLPVSEIVKAMVASNIDVMSAYPCGDNLEDYFKEITA